MQLKSTQSYKGFTLVELIVSLGLFITVMTIAIGALFSAQSINARLQATRNILDGLNLSFELLSREVRYGSLFFCGDDIVDARKILRKSCAFSANNPNAGGSVLVFKPVAAASPLDRVGYYATNGKLYEWKSEGGVETTRQISSNEVIIDTFHFFVLGANTTQEAIDAGNAENVGGVSDNVQPQITIILTGKTFPRNNPNDRVVDFQLQTTISPRGLDY